MTTKKEMQLWLSENTSLSENSIYKYAHAAETISKKCLIKELFLSVFSR